MRSAKDELINNVLRHTPTHRHTREQWLIGTDGERESQGNPCCCHALMMKIFLLLEEQQIKKQKNISIKTEIVFRGWFFL